MHFDQGKSLELDQMYNFINFFLSLPTNSFRYFKSPLEFYIISGSILRPIELSKLSKKSEKKFILKSKAFYRKIYVTFRPLKQASQTGLSNSV